MSPLVRCIKSTRRSGECPFRRDGHSTDSHHTEPGDKHDSRVGAKRRVSPDYRPQRRYVALIAASPLIAGGSAFACVSPVCPCQTLHDGATALSRVERQEASRHASAVNVHFLGYRELLRETLEGSAARVLPGELASRSLTYPIAQTCSHKKNPRSTRM